MQKGIKIASLYLIVTLFIAVSLYLVVEKSIYLMYALPILLGVLMLYFFSYDKVLNFDGETSVYVQYTCARANSVLQKGGVVTEYEVPELTAEEIELVKALATFPETVLSSAEKYEPSFIARFAVDVAQKFNKFYFDCKILAAEDEKNAIRDMVEEGINLELDALQELIDKKNEELESVREIFYWNMRKFAGYPISIYSKLIQGLMIYVVPFAFVNYFPAQYLLRKPDMANYNEVYMYIAPLVGVVVYALAYVFWRVSVKRYTSTGN